MLQAQSSYGRPSVAFVIPVHNVAPYLPACLDSIIGQTIRNIEIICVDDASTDESPSILSRYAKADDRVKVVLLPKNQGQSVARNEGLQHVTAEWVVFVDSDDLACHELAECCLRSATATSADVVFFDYLYFNDGEDPPRFDQSYERLPITRQQLLEGQSFPWIRCTKADFLKQSEIRFPVGLLMQDIPVHWRVVLESANPVKIASKLILYRQRWTSVSYGSSWKRADGFKVYDLVRSYLGTRPDRDRWTKSFLRKELEIFADISATFMSSNPRLSSRAHQEVMKRMTKQHWELLLAYPDFPRAKRDLLLATCRPSDGSRSSQQVVACFRHAIRRLTLKAKLARARKCF